MKTLNALTLLLMLAIFTVGAFGAAPKKKKPAPTPTPPTVDQEAVKVLKPYDKDGNFEISREELVAMQTDYKASPRGPLKEFDLDHNGILDDVVDRASMNMKLGQLKMNKETPKATPKKKKK